MNKSLVFKSLEVEFESSEAHLAGSPLLYGPGTAYQNVCLEVPMNDEGIPKWDKATIDMFESAFGFYADSEGEEFEVEFEPTDSEVIYIKEKAIDYAIQMYHDPSYLNHYQLKEAL